MKKLWNKDFILLLQGSTVSIIGDLMYSVAIGYWVYEQTGSNSLMGIMSSISMFVTMFLSPFSGSIIDKVNRKWVMVGIDLIQGVLMIAVGILAYTQRLNVPIVLIAALLASFGSVFYSPASSTLMLDIIPRDDMVRGQSIFSGASTIVSMVGTAFSGVMVAFFGVPLIVIINGLSNIYSAISELFINVPKTINQGAEINLSGIITDIKTAVKTILSEPCLKIFVPSALLLNLLGAGAFSLMLPFCLEKEFSVDMYGYLMSIWTAASLVSVVILGAIKFSPKARFWIMALSFTASTILLAFGYLSRSFVLLCIFASLGAITNTAGNTIFNASLMLALPEENRSAILGFLQSASTGGMALSTLIYGLLGDVFPLQYLFAIGTLLSLAPMMYLCFNRKTREFILSN
ncbi:MAG: MFS transporter [Clostridia bacterium]|nr:MFS transporter [Clostridia bacterium]